MKRFIGRHRIRASFYHVVASIFLLSTILWSFDIISDKTSFIIGLVLFVIDYLAEMYDPNPSAPGTWFKRHFHRFLEDEDV